jgi:hypothetical protein
MTPAPGVDSATTIITGGVPRCDEAHPRDHARDVPGFDKLCPGSAQPPVDRLPRRGPREGSQSTCARCMGARAAVVSPVTGTQRYVGR